MKNSAQNEISITRVAKNKDNLTELLNEYKNIHSFSSFYKRFKNNNNKRGVITFLVTLVLSMIVIFGTCYFTQDFVMSIITCFVTLFIARMRVTKERANIKKHHYEMEFSRQDDICKLLRARGIDSRNIKDVIDYFTVESEPMGVIVNDFPKLNTALLVLCNLFSVILGCILQNSANIIIHLVFIALVLLIIILLIVLFKCIAKDSYTPKIRKLVRDLKIIDSLNSMEVL